MKKSRRHRIWRDDPRRVRRAIEYLTAPNDPAQYPDQAAMQEALHKIKETA